MAVELLQSGYLYARSIEIKTSLENLTINGHEQRGVIITGRDIRGCQ
jgi:hypothetical protein